MSRGIRPSTTRSAAALWVKSLLNALWFFALFMALLPWGAHWLWPRPVGIPLSMGRLWGAILCGGGLVVWGICLDVFSRRGRGTPFPLDAPRHLVTTGPFAVVRNPIIAGELAVIWGEALYIASLGMLAYAMLMTLAGHLAVRLVEEPELRERFGAAYDDYCRRVPRWLPRWPGSKGDRPPKSTTD